VSISSLDLNLVLVLHTVLAERNVARAAERLHVTPSAVSNALARLREVLGDPLVTRKGRGVVPTPRAAELAPGLARIVGELEAMLSTTPFDPATCARTFTLAVSDLGQVIWAPRLVAAMQREMPLARLRVVGIDSLVSLGDLASSEIDLQLGVAAEGPGLYAEPLLEERSALVARRDHPLFERRVTRRALGELGHVRVEMVPGKSFRDPFAAAYAQAGVPRRIVATVPSFTAAAEIAAAGDLVTMLPSSFFRAKGRGIGLREVPAPLPAHATPIAMCWHERTHADPAARAFRALLRGVVTERPISSSRSRARPGPEP
jgi:DNA-binding transcriptional LysR family regulator